MGVYEELGVRRVINACSTATHLGGSIPDPRVMEAMEAAVGRYVIMMELGDSAGEVIVAYNKLEPDKVRVPTEADRHSFDEDGVRRVAAKTVTDVRGVWVEPGTDEVQTGKVGLETALSRYDDITADLLARLDAIRKRVEAGREGVF